MKKKLITAIICAALMAAPLYGSITAYAENDLPSDAQTVQSETEPEPEPEPKPEPEPHKHNYICVSKTTATCTAAGKKVYKCECGKSYTETAPKLGHKYSAVKTVKPTLTSKGYTLYRCSRCKKEIKKNYTAKLINIKSVKVSGVKASYKYTGKAQTPSPVLKKGSKKLVKGKDYTISYTNNKKKGTAKITIKGKGKYAGKKVLTFKIKAASIKKAKVTGLKVYNKYTGKKITQSVKVKLGSKKLKKGTDYTISYKNNKKLGTAQIIIKGKGNYSGTVTKKFKIVRMGWFEKNGSYYHYNSKGRKDADGEYKIGDNYYYLGKNGIRQYGWVKVGSNYRLYDRKNGKRVTNATVDGIKINKKGNAVLDDWATSKIETMIKAKNILNEITCPTDTMEQKKLKAFNWVLAFPYHQYRLLRPIYRQQDWEMTFANDIFDNHQGCCVAESAAIAFLFREIGYTDVYVCHDTGHSWVTIGDYLYDPVFAEAKSFSANYGVIPTDYRINPVDKRYIG